jgi:hypothetical protein
MTTMTAPANNAEMYRLMARHEDLVRALLRRPLTAAEDAELMAIEGAFDAIEAR